MKKTFNKKENELFELLKKIEPTEDFIIPAFLIAKEDDRFDELISFIKENANVDTEDVMLFLVPEDEE